MSSRLQRAASRRPLRDLAAIGALALALRAGLGLLLPVAPAWDGVVYARGAAWLARDGRYTQRAIRDDAPDRASAFYPVGWPAVLSVARRLVPSVDEADAAATTAGHPLDLPLQSLFGALAAGCAYLLGRRAGGRRAGLVAGLLVALAPGSVLVCATWLAEPLFTALLALAALPLAYARRAHRLRALALSAFVLGLAAYVRPVALPIALLVGVALALRAPLRVRFARQLRAVALYGAVSLSLALAPLTPWIARNAALLHAPVLVSTNGGANLLLGTVGDGRYGAIPRALDCPNGLREVVRDRCRTQRALERIRAAPLAAAMRGAHKLFDTFGYEVSPALAVEAGLPARFAARRALAIVGSVASTAHWLALVALAMIALVRRRGPAVLRDFALAALLATALLHAIYLGGDRYHLPLVPLFAALAGAVVTTRTRRRKARVSSRAASRRDHRR